MSNLTKLVKDEKVAVIRLNIAKANVAVKLNRGNAKGLTDPVERATALRDCAQAELDLANMELDLAKVRAS